MFSASHATIFDPASVRSILVTCTDCSQKLNNDSIKLLKHNFKGRLKNGILDGFSGTVGTVVGGNWRGVQSMSGDSHNTRNKDTPAQQEQKAKFALAIRFTRSMGDRFEISHEEKEK